MIFVQHIVPERDLAGISWFLMRAAKDEALSGARKIQMSGKVITFSMPNGQRARVTLKAVDSILDLTAANIAVLEYEIEGQLASVPAPKAEEKPVAPAVEFEPVVEKVEDATGE